MTGSTAIGDELCEYYGGEKILKKHSGYRDFMKNASSTEKTYYKFSGIRNPLDTAVSMYFKLKNEPRFLDPLYPTKNKDNFIRATYIASNKADFNDFFMRFLTRNIYDEIKTHDFNKLNYIYRFENIQEEFSRILTRLGLNQIRPLPLIKKTPERQTDFTLYYKTDKIRRTARLIFSKYMAQWDYDFPTDWPNLQSKEYFKYSFLNFKKPIKDCGRLALTVLKKI